MKCKFTQWAVFGLFIFGIKSAVANETTHWYGVLSSVTFPLTDCKTIAFKGLQIHNWMSNGSPERLLKETNSMQKNMETSARKEGYNAVINYTEQFLGGGGPLRQRNVTNIVLTGTISVKGVAVKIVCK